MTLAIDAIGVPNPPMLDPASSPCQSVVNCESITVAGTLLMTWLIAAVDTAVFQSSMSRIASFMTSIVAMFPAKTNRKMNVRIRP